MEFLSMSSSKLNNETNDKTTEDVINAGLSQLEIDSTVTLLDPDGEYSCEYKDEIWHHLLQEDARRPTFYMQSPQLEFRGTLVQQLRDLTTKLELNLATLHSAVANLDLFMDSHRMKADGLIYIALACLSLAAKSEEKYSQAPSLKKLSRISNVQLIGKSFRQLEWMIGEHLEWRLLAPTAVHFAALLSQYVVTDKDLTTRHPRLVLRLKRDASKFLDEYLDLSLSDVRLKTVDAVDVGCACIACARVELGFVAWPHWLVKKVNRPSAPIARLAALLEKMMRIMRTRDNKSVEPEAIDGGYVSSRTSVSSTPTMSPGSINSDSSSPNGTPNDNMPGVKPKEVTKRLLKIPYRIDIDKYHKLLSQPDTTVQRVNLTEHAYCKNDRTIENTLNIAEEPINLTKKRHLLRDIDDEVETKRVCLASYLMNFEP